MKHGLKDISCMNIKNFSAGSVLFINFQTAFKVILPKFTVEMPNDDLQAILDLECMLYQNVFYCVNCVALHCVGEWNLNDRIFLF